MFEFKGERTVSTDRIYRWLRALSTALPLNGGGGVVYGWDGLFPLFSPLQGWLVLRCLSVEIFATATACVRSRHSKAARRRATTHDGMTFVVYQEGGRQIAAEQYDAPIGTVPAG